MQYKLLRLLLFIVCAQFTSIAIAQENQDPPRNKHLEKAEKKRAKQDKKAEKEAFKRHEKIQDKKTRKRMKKNKKKSERMHKNKREPFLKRLFTKH